ncbi:MAG TPA: hypothetical protein VF092_18060 [Longimicrobium sp.]
MLITAEEGTDLPFDQQMIPCFFWREADGDAERQERLVEFWAKYVDPIGSLIAGEKISGDYISPDIEVSRLVPPAYNASW